jgi:hypothetical protein
VAAASFVRSTLYWQSTCFCAAVQWVSEDLSRERRILVEKGELTDNTSYSCRDELNDVYICGVLGFDEDSGT